MKRIGLSYSRCTEREIFIWKPEGLRRRRRLNKSWEITPEDGERMGRKKQINLNSTEQRIVADGL